mmetsp:Transcript_5617/g.16648  ORF Transcript_5617/g.16648 Transcript_5617/m.16648 type:complete len:184 (+) Transcript_5617:961-1512(+)
MTAAENLPHLRPCQRSSSSVAMQSLLSSATMQEEGAHAVVGSEESDSSSSGSSFQVPTAAAAGVPPPTTTQRPQEEERCSSAVVAPAVATIIQDVLDMVHRDTTSGFFDALVSGDLSGFEEDHAVNEDGDRGIPASMRLIGVLDGRRVRGGAGTVVRLGTRSSRRGASSSGGRHGMLGAAPRQ